MLLKLVTTITHARTIVLFCPGEEPCSAESGSSCSESVEQRGKVKLHLTSHRLQ